MGKSASGSAGQAGTRTKPAASAAARVIAISAFTVLAGCLVFYQLGDRLGQAMTASTGWLSLLAFFVFAVAHSIDLEGRQATAMLLGLTFTVSLALESIGVATGLIYGAYQYTSILGPKFLGLVPLAIPLAWFMMVYASRSLARLIVGPGRRADLGSTAAFALLCALIMTAWDLGVDPRAVRVMKMWIWRDGGAWFGVPLQNYAGWVLTTFLIYLLYGLWERRQDAVSQPAASPISVLPAAGYALMAANEVVAAREMGEPALALAVGFTMGGFVVAGACGLLRDRGGAVVVSAGLPAGQSGGPQETNGGNDAGH